MKERATEQFQMFGLCCVKTAWAAFCLILHKIFHILFHTLGKSGAPWFTFTNTGRTDIKVWFYCPKYRSHSKKNSHEYRQAEVD